MVPKEKAAKRALKTALHPSVFWQAQTGATACPADVTASGPTSPAALLGRLLALHCRPVRGWTLIRFCWQTSCRQGRPLSQECLGCGMVTQIMVLPSDWPPRGAWLEVD